jgi:hypothetical protein
MKSNIRRCVVALVALLAVCVFSSSPAFAQGIGVGVKVGPTFNDFTSEEAPDGQTGWMGGLFIGGNRSGRVGAAVEFNYAKKSARLEDEDGNSVDADLRYFQIPVLMRFNGGSRTREGVNVYGIVGPFFNFKVGASAGGGFGDQFDEATEDIDAGIVVGGGVEITRFIIEFRYDFGLRRINADDEGGVSDVKSRTAAILFGFRFN